MSIISLDKIENIRNMSNMELERKWTTRLLWIVDRNQGSVRYMAQHTTTRALTAQSVKSIQTHGADEREDKFPSLSEI